MDIEGAKILVVDDDVAIGELLEQYLGSEGFNVASVLDGQGMDRFLVGQTVDLIILDVMLPGEDGLSIARRLRKDYDTPILMLSARGDEVDRIVGLEVGADDYLPKPFNPRELLARVRAILRRNHPPAQEKEPIKSVSTFGDFTLDLESQLLSCDGANVPLTSGEFALLRVLTQHPNRVLSRDTLIDMLSGHDRSPYDRSIDVRITRLRQKIEKDHKSPIYIHTVWGEGYRFSPN
ncbi:MAG: response regulator [Proteobacteria bacterium]|nr:response regulator [Pseudomonadota bacterium]